MLFGGSRSSESDNGHPNTIKTVRNPQGVRFEQEEYSPALHGGSSSKQYFEVQPASSVSPIAENPMRISELKLSENAHQQPDQQAVIHTQGKSIMLEDIVVDRGFEEATTVDSYNSKETMPVISKGSSNAAGEIDRLLGGDYSLAINDDDGELAEIYANPTHGGSSEKMDLDPIESTLGGAPAKTYSVPNDEMRSVTPDPIFSDSDLVQKNTFTQWDKIAGGARPGRGNRIPSSSIGKSHMTLTEDMEGQSTIQSGATVKSISSPKGVDIDRLKSDELYFGSAEHIENMYVYAPVSTDDSLSKTAGGAQFHIRQNKHTLDVAERERFGTKRGAKHAQMFFLEPKSADTVEIIPVRLEIRKSALYRRGQGGEWHEDASSTVSRESTYETVREAMLPSRTSVPKTSYVLHPVVVKDERSGALKQHFWLQKQTTEPIEVRGSQRRGDDRPIPVNKTARTLAEMLDDLNSPTEDEKTVTDTFLGLTRSDASVYLEKVNNRWEKIEFGTSIDRKDIDVIISYVVDKGAWKDSDRDSPLNPRDHESIRIYLRRHLSKLPEEIITIFANFIHAEARGRDKRYYDSTNVFREEEFIKLQGEDIERLTSLYPREFGEDKSFRDVWEYVVNGIANGYADKMIVIRSEESPDIAKPSSSTSPRTPPRRPSLPSPSYRTPSRSPLTPSYARDQRSLLSVTPTIRRRQFFPSDTPSVREVYSVSDDLHHPQANSSTEIQIEFHDERNNSVSVPYLIKMDIRKASRTLDLAKSLKATFEKFFESIDHIFVKVLFDVYYHSNTSADSDLGIKKILSYEDVDHNMYLTRPLEKITNQISAYLHAKYNIDPPPSISDYLFSINVNSLGLSEENFRSFMRQFTKHAYEKIRFDDPRGIGYGISTHSEYSEPVYDSVQSQAATPLDVDALGETLWD